MTRARMGHGVPMRAHGMLCLCATGRLYDRLALAGCKSVSGLHVRSARSYAV